MRMLRNDQEAGREDSALILSEVLFTFPPTIRVARRFNYYNDNATYYIIPASGADFGVQVAAAAGKIGAQAPSKLA